MKFVALPVSSASVLSVVHFSPVTHFRNSMAIHIGSQTIASSVFAAPMAGVSDKPYRKLCRRYGAGLAVSEMVTSKLELKDSVKSRFRMDLAGESEPVCVQIVGTEPERLAAAAAFNVQNGAQIIDINMGCPAKKVCKKAAGSALLEDEPLVERIFNAVVAAVSVPVTVKIRTGPSPERRNAVRIAKLAQNSGIQAITVHGRTRQCRFVGEVEYTSIAEVKAAVDIPVIANGDIDTPHKAAAVLQSTGADAVMIGRAAQGQPWLFEQIIAHLETGQASPLPTLEERADVILNHIHDIHQFYGERLGLKLARKHIKWYLQHWPEMIQSTAWENISTTEVAADQRELCRQFLHASINKLAA